MKYLSILAMTVLSACQVAAPAGSAPTGFVTANGTRVNPVNDTLFEVIPHVRAGYDAYWCGAAEYARRKLGADWSDHVYVASGISPGLTTGRRSTVRFTLSPEAAGITPIELNPRTGMKVGDNMSITQAHGRCSVFRPRFI